MKNKYRFIPIEGRPEMIAVVKDEEYQGSIILDNRGRVIRRSSNVTIEAKQAFYEWCAVELLFHD